MKIRGLLVALALLAVLAGGIWYSNRRDKGKDTAAKADATPNVLTLKDADVTRIEIAHRGGETMVLERDSALAWKITAPVEYPVDRDALTALVAAVATVASDKVADLSQYGMTEPALAVTVRLKDGKSKKIAIGDATAIGSAFYAVAQGDSHVYTVASYTKEALDKKSADLRDRRMLTFNSDKLARVVLAAQKTETEFGKNASGDWQIVKPKPYRADVFSVDDLVRRLKDVKLDPALSGDDEKKATASFGSAAPLATVTVTDANGSQKLEIRKAKTKDEKDDKYYARSSVVEGVYTVEATTAKTFDKTTDDFRNKKIFDFGFNDPSRVDYHSAKVQTTVSKAGEKWFRGGKPLDSNSIQTFIDKLRDLSATKFAESGFGASELEITVVSSDGKKVEKVSLAKSGAVPGSGWLARRDGDASLYVIPAATVDEFEHAAADLKEDQSKPTTKK